MRRNILFKGMGCLSAQYSILGIKKDKTLNKTELLTRLSDIEWDDFEVKEAKSELPKNIWETVSAFANSSGGWIVLGISQKGKNFEVSGVENPEKLEQNFTTVLRSRLLRIY